MQKIIIFLFVGIMFQGIPAKADMVRFITHGVEDATYIDPNGELRGLEGKGLRAFLVEAVREMLILTGRDDIEIEVLPFARGLLRVQEKDNFALFNTSRSKAREHSFKWVGPLYEGNVYFYKRPGFPDVTTLEQAKEAGGIGVQQGAGDEAYLEQLGFTNIQRVRTQGHALKMLSVGRVDLAPVGNYVVEPLMRQFNIPVGSIVKTSLKLSDTRGYIAVSINVSDEKISQLQGALDHLKSTEKFDELIRKYLITH